MAYSPSKTKATRASLAIWDVLSWLLATSALVAARYDFAKLSEYHTKLIFSYATIAVVLQLVIGLVSKLYFGRYRLASLDEAIHIGLVVLAIGVSLAIYYLFSSDPGYPRGVMLTVPLGAYVLAMFGRFLGRAWATRPQHSSAEPIIVYGAGNAGQQLARLLVNDPDAPYRIVGFIDDDPAKSNLHIGRHRVQGSREKLVDLAVAKGVRTVVVAIPTATGKQLQEIAALTDDAGLNLLVMPQTKDIVAGKVAVNQLHQLDILDLLGRSQVDTNLSEIAGYLSGKVVLITGAGGSIGAEIARQVHRFGPKELVLLDRDESALAAVQLSIYNQALLDTPNMVLCDIRDYEALDKIFADHRPDVIFHAAALKHLPMLEQYPYEGWKTNVIGSLNLLKLAKKYQVSRYVNISTDKAADATSVLGKTKRIAEELTAYYATQQGLHAMSVRFGNVLGSRGSVLHTFKAQIEAGGPLTVTHPDIERYFMTIPEACQLVIQAGGIGQPGDVMVLDMGKPMKILDVAKMLITRSGKNIEIVFTGLRPNEKLSEALFSNDENPTPTSHSLINRVKVSPLSPAELDTVDGSDPESFAKLTKQAYAEQVAKQTAIDMANAPITLARDAFGQEITND